MDIKSVAILGTGLMGASLGLAAKRAGVSDVAGYDLDPAHSAEAQRLGCIDRAARSPGKGVEGADLVMLATPVGVMQQVLSEALGGLKPSAVVTDVGSTKGGVTRQLEDLLDGKAFFVGGHPMAGSEQEGTGAARADLFEGVFWVLTPTSRTDSAAYGKLHRFLTGLGAHVIALDPVKHDQLVAVVSHLPQMIATALILFAAEVARDEDSLAFLAAGGFRDMTRVAASPPEIWLDVAKENSGALMDAGQAFTASLEALLESVRKQDWPALARLFDEGRKAKNRLAVGPGVAISQPPVEIIVSVPDRPGVLAEVTTAVGGLGVNIEDLSILHLAKGGRGTLRLWISGAEPARRAAAELSKLGYEAEVEVEL